MVPTTYWGNQKQLLIKSLAFFWVYIITPSSWYRFIFLPLHPVVHPPNFLNNASRVFLEKKNGNPFEFAISRGSWKTNPSNALFHGKSLKNYSTINFVWFHSPQNVKFDDPLVKLSHLLGNIPAKLVHLNRRSTDAPANLCSKASLKTTGGTVEIGTPEPWRVIPENKVDVICAPLHHLSHEKKTRPDTFHYIYWLFFLRDP